MKNKFVIKIILGLAVILLQSCATILYGPTEKIKITSAQNNLELKVNGKVTDTIANQITLKKKYKNPTLEIFKPGFEKETFKFHRVRRNGAQILALEGIVFGGIGLMTTTPLYFLLKPTKTSNPQAIIGPFIAASAALVVGSSIDYITHSANTFIYDSLRFDLTPDVKKVSLDSVSSFNCSSVIFKIKNGATIGKAYKAETAKVKFVEDLTWLAESNASFSDLKNEMNAELLEVGYTKENAANKKSDANNKYSLVCEVNNVKLNQYNFIGEVERVYQTANVIGYKIHYNPDNFCELNTKWSLINNFNDEVVFERTISSSSFVNNESASLVIKKTLVQSIKKLMSDKEFITATKKHINNTKSNSGASDAFEKLIFETTVPKSNLSEVIESAITIDLGKNGHGSGFIISKDGYAITNYHVIEGLSKVNVILSNGLSLEANVLRSNEKRDIALIKITGNGFKALSLSKETALIGSNITAIGTPGKKELGQTISKGIVSGKREIDANIFLQTDINISPGSSGGPIINDKNEVIGVITSKLIGEGVEGIGFAIPIVEAIEKLSIEFK